MVLTEAPVITTMTERGSSEIILPPKYRATLDLIAQTSQRLNVPYAILGSIGTASASNTILIIRDFSGPWRIGNPDIDVFVIGTDQKREEFISVVRSQLSEDSPLVDFSAGHHHQNVGFDNDGNPYLRYKKIRIPLSRRLFEPAIALASNPQIPVLSPQTYIAMTTLCNNTIYSSRTAARIESLEKACQQFPDLNEELLKPFDVFKTEVRKHYPFHYPIIDIRRQIAANPSLLRYVSELKKLAPGLIKMVRKIY